MAIIIVILIGIVLSLIPFFIDKGKEQIKVKKVKVKQVKAKKVNQNQEKINQKVKKLKRRKVI